ncbi:hypothetical protein JW835_12435 [bacterium]|nr:hypothetical protein [bacterium]
MKRYIIMSMASCLICSVLHADNRSIKMSSRLNPYITFNEDTRIYMRQGNVIIRTQDLADGKVMINNDFELIINRDTLELDDQQQKMVFEYYQLVNECLESAKKIGWEGAKVGIQGAAIGVKAVAGVFRMILPNYGPDELERDMELEASKIEAKAEKLEEKAEIIEEKLDILEDIHHQLREEIPELKQLEWF